MSEENRFLRNIRAGIQLDRPDVLMKWGAPLREVIALSNATVHEAEKWDSDPTGKIVKVKRVSVAWTSFQIEALPHIVAAKASFKEFPNQPAPQFQEIQMFFSEELMASANFEERRKAGRTEVEKALGPSHVRDVNFNDRGSTVSYDIDEWVLPGNIWVTFQPASGLIIYPR